MASRWFYSVDHVWDCGHGRFGTDRVCCRVLLVERTDYYHAVIVFTTRLQLAHGVQSGAIIQWLCGPLDGNLTRAAACCQVC